MRHYPRLAAAAIGALLVAKTVGAAEQSAAADAYANDPYWYKPGHPTSPADVRTIKTAPGFRIERILTVPSEMGSWISLCVDPAGQLIASAQQQPGLFRVTPPPLDDADAQAHVEKLGGAPRPDRLVARAALRLRQPLRHGGRAE